MYNMETEDQAREVYSDMIADFGFILHGGDTHTKCLASAIDIDPIAVNEAWSNWIDCMLTDGMVPEEAVDWCVTD